MGAGEARELAGEAYESAGEDHAPAATQLNNAGRVHRNTVTHGNLCGEGSRSLRDWSVGKFWAGRWEGRVGLPPIDPCGILLATSQHSDGRITAFCWPWKTSRCASWHSQMLMLTIPQVRILST